jgi:release factor glutamine methyltransferase
MTQTDFYETHLQHLTQALVVLPDKPEETPETTLAALWFAAAGRPLSVEAASQAPRPDLDGAARAALDGLIARRLSGVPLAHITGRQRFMGLELLAGPDALVPRKETELLGRTALEKLKAMADARGSVTAIDVCTGSGNLALALNQHEPRARVFAADLSVEAVALARRNAAHLGAGDHVTFFDGDLFGAFPEALLGQADLVVCNPPYISSAKVDAMAAEIAGHEPRLAFDGGGFGLGIVSRLIKEAPLFLKPGSWLCFEIGLGQGKFLKGSLAKAGAYAVIEAFEDAEGQIRVLAAQTP